jgi:hypothetical protein
MIKPQEDSPKMPAAQPLTPTVAFWLEALDIFDIHQDGPRWTSWCPTVQPTIHEQDQLVDLVREGIVIQQFLLELVTRRGLRRDLVVGKLNTLLAAEPA